ncbi:hypothetical protein WN944_007246 [Citrus x changshan-huyou]|uniref:AAA+ ATPase domain-containing protein n=1 Tax=Citrus x changshan-huyou TaxID=2935761 RepID=A0AAP0MNA8_9ROSI
MAEIILTIVVQVVKCLAPPAYRQISYFRESKYTSNLQNLKTEVEKLKSERVRTERQVDEAKRKGEEIEENVENWLARANNAIEEADKFTNDEAAAHKHCFNGLCPNLKSRRWLSKEAVRQKEAVVEVRGDGGFDRISYRTSPQDIRLSASKGYEAFESRMPTLTNILSALEDPDVNMLGIWGMGGIGKTMLAEEVARKVKSDKLFDQVVFVEVSQSQDIRKIQGEIADKLSLKLDEESESGRADRLCEVIKKVKKILIVLDNIWKGLHLWAVGIPHGDGHKGCKILLTARSEDVLSREMDSQRNFSVGFLKEEEAWSLFKKMAGDYVEGNELKEVARDVAKECAGLPVVIVTVARALRNKSLREWKDALEQLRRPSSSNFKDVQPAAYNAIELSYNKLERDELKKTFLLIGYTATESIDELLMHGMGFDLFQGANNMEAARDRVHALVSTPKASCMLLDHISKNEESFSMHDVVRDVAISIASTRNVFTATNEQVDGCRKWSDGSAIKHRNSIVLHGIKSNFLPEVVECPQLELLFLRAGPWESSSLTIPNNFFERMTEIVLPLPSSLGLLSNLRTLSLRRCSLPDISFVGYLKKLEILCLRGSMIKKLPVELSKLGGGGGRVKNASLEELKHLPNLTSLELYIDDVSTLPRGLFLEKLEGYIIRIGVGGRFWERTNIGVVNKVCLKDSLIVQLQRIEDLDLRGLQEQDVDYFANELVKMGSSQLKRLHMSGSRLALNPAESEFTSFCTGDVDILEFPSLKQLSINKCPQSMARYESTTSFLAGKVALPKLKHLDLYSINVERIWQNQVASISCGIQNLAYLILYCCVNLRCLFSSSTVSSFVRLQSIEIIECPVLEELIVMDNQEERKNNIVAFPQLQYLRMDDLEKLTSFCTGDVDILEFPYLKELDTSLCPQFMARYKSTTSFLTGKVALPNLENLELKSINVERIWQNQVADVSCGIQNLAHLRLDKCWNLRCLFSSSTLCGFLQYLEMSHLEKFTSFCTGDVDILEFPSLKRLRIFRCPEFMLFPNLEELEVDAKFIVTNKYLFSEDLHCKLKYLFVELVDERTILSLHNFLQRLHTMKVLQIEGYSDRSPIVKVENGMGNLTNLVVSCCNSLKIVITSSIAKTLRIEGVEAFTLKKSASFYSGNCAFNFLSLERLVVDDCPDMKIFSAGKLSTPKLHKVQRLGEACWDWKDDLNTTIQKRLAAGSNYSVKKTAFVNCEPELGLSEGDDFVVSGIE